MPNNIRRDSAGGELADLRRRLERIENVPQSGHTSILNGTLDVLDADGRIVSAYGIQADGTVGLAVFDPATGQKLMQAGQDPGGGGLYGLSVWNGVTGKFQRVAGTTTAVQSSAQYTASTTFVTFVDDPTVTAIIGSGGQAEVTFGTTIGTGGDGDQGTMFLSIGGVPTTEHVSVSSAAPAAGVQATVTRTTVISSIPPGPASFSVAYKCATGVHGVTFSNRFLTIRPL